MKINQNSLEVSIFRGREAPEKGFLAGYGALIKTYDLKVPLPERLALVSEKHKRYTHVQWQVFTPRYAPSNDLYGHLTFALKYEGVDLYILKTLFNKVGAADITKVVMKEPLGQYARRVWFLYEWLFNEKLPVPDLKTGNFVDLLDSSIQYPGPSENSGRHRIRNNLPGVQDFCPLIYRTPELDQYISLNLAERVKNSLNEIHKDVLLRAAAFLLLKDSQASYAIEGENPPHNRAQRWGKAIAQAGNKPLSKEELLRLQQIVIEDDRFIKMGWRSQEGFVGEHDRATGNPIPDHISARYKDINALICGLIDTDKKLQHADYDPVLAATLIAFGFVYIHPFVDGNGRLHRYLIHHVLAVKNFTQKQFIFPVSAAILQKIDEYKKVLEAFSIPRLDLIKWKQSPDNNVVVLNETMDLYRYFDATKEATFLYNCVIQTIDEIVPKEVAYLYQYDQFKNYIDNHFDMPDHLVALLVKFLAQNGGKLSKRARENEFNKLKGDEINNIEIAFSEIFNK